MEKAVKDAVQYAEEDKKAKEKIDTRNEADQMVYQTERTMADLGDKVTEDEKTQLNEKKDALKKALEGEDLDDIKAKQEDLTKALQEVSTRIYQEAGAQAQGAEGAAAGPMR